MSKSSRRRNLADVHRLTGAVIARLAKLEATFAAETEGYAMASGGDGPGARNAITDRTGAAAIANTKARADERELDRHLKAAARALTAANSIAEHWTTAMPAKVEELAALERAADKGCEIVGKISRGGGCFYWEPEHRTSDIGGLLARPYRLGKWAYRFARTNGRLPTEAEATTHCEGRRVYVKA